jgi:hypothetical protein
MNDQIKLLAEQAGYKPLPGFDFANSLQEVFMKKFAELIVQDLCEQGTATQTTSSGAANMIRQHFGVNYD